MSKSRQLSTATSLGILAALVICVFVAMGVGIGWDAVVKGWRTPATAEAQSDPELSGLADRLTGKAAEDAYHLGQREGTVEAMKALEALGYPSDWERQKLRLQALKISTFDSAASKQIVDAKVLAAYRSGWLSGFGSMHRTR